MSVVTIPIIAKILYEESKRVATPEICEFVWRKIYNELAETKITDSISKPKVINSI